MAKISYKGVLMNRIFCTMSILICFFCATIFGVSQAVADNQGKFRRVGYFKDSKKNRIYTISYQSGTIEKEIRSYAEKLMYTHGRMMAAYFYPKGSSIPADGLTLAKSILQANRVLYDLPGLSSWSYAFMRHFKGTTKFMDCRQIRNDDLCRKK